jgi:hypothetical protein
MLLYFIFMFGHGDVTPAKVALLLMPLTIELALGEVMLEMMAMGFKMILSIIVAEGEMMALTWVVEPLLVQLILFELPPPKEPPEPRQYLTKATRKKKRGRWADLWEGAREMLSPPTAATRLGNRGMSKNEARTTTRSLGAERKRGTRYNAKMAKGMRLIMVTCMSATTLQGTTAFDSDSKQIAIGNCSS